MSSRVTQGSDRGASAVEPGPATKEGIDVLWGKEAEERPDAFDRGEIKAISAKQVFEELCKKPL